MLHPVTRSLPLEVSRRLVRQFRLPSPARFVIEASLIAGLFMACVWMSGDAWVSATYEPMIWVTAVMMVAMTASGVYRREIWNSVENIYLHGAYGFVIAGSAALITLSQVAPRLLQGKFAFLFLFLTFFALNTIRPLLSGSEITNGGGRRAR